MTKLEQLKFNYLEAKGEMEAYQSDEKCAHKKAIEWENKMKEIEKEIKEIEENNKLNESIETIRNYCIGKPCRKCVFYSSTKDYQGMAIPCKLLSLNPAHWENIK